MHRVFVLLAAFWLATPLVANPPKEPLTSAEQLTRLLDEIAPDGGTARPPYDLAGHDIEIASDKPATTDKAWMSTQALRRGRALAERWSQLRVAADKLDTPAARAGVALLRYALGKAELKTAVEAALGAGAPAQRRLAGLLEAEARFDDAARLWLALAKPALGTQPTEAAPAWQAVRRLVRLQKLRTALATRVQVMPMRVDIDTFLASLTKRHEARVRALAETIKADLFGDQGEEEVRRSDRRPEDSMSQVSGGRARAVLKTASGDLQVSTIGSGTVRDRPLQVKLFSRYNGAIEMALHRFDRAAWFKGTLAERLAASEPLVRWTHDVHPIEANNSEVTRAIRKLEGLAEGFYVVTAGARYAPELAYSTFVVSRTRLFLRAAVNGVVGVAFDAKRGTPKAGVPVILRIRRSLDRNAVVNALSELPGVDHSEASAAYDGRPPIHANDADAARYARAAAALAVIRERTPQTETVLRGVTNADGMVRIETELEEPLCAYSLRLIRADSGYAEASSSLNVSRSAGRNRAIVWTQQPLRRPGEAVRLSGVVKRYADGAWKATAKGERSLELIGPGGVVCQQPVIVDERGMFAAELELPGNAPLGKYSVRIAGTSASPQSVLKVGWFRRPPLAVKLVLDRQRIGAGVPQEGEVRVELPGGGPASGAVVEVQRPLYGRCYRLLRTDERGVARFSLPALPAQEVERSVLVLAQVSGSDGQVVSARRNVDQDPAPFSVRLEHEAQAIAGEPTPVLVVAESWTGAPLAGATVIIDGQRKSLTTDAKGQLKAALVLRKRGRHPVSVTVVAGGAVTSQQSSIRVKGSPGNGPGQLSGDGVLIRAAECERSGEALKVTLQLSRKAKAPAKTAVLLLVQQRGLMHHQMLSLAPGKHELQLPTTHAWATGVHVFAIAFCSEEQIQDSRYCKIAPSDKLVDLTIETDEAKYAPGAPVRATLSARDFRGRPLAGVRLTLGVVDEAIYQLRADATAQLREFFYGHRMPNRVTNGRMVPAHRRGGHIFLGPKLCWASPWSQRYGRFNNNAIGAGGSAGGTFGGRRGGAAAALRSNFSSSAHWVADLVTDARGQVEVRFNLPDDMASWRFTARAVGAGLLVGELRTKRAASLPLEVDIMRPRGLRAGDQIQLPAQARNRSGRELDVQFGHAGQPLAQRSLRAGESAMTLREIAPEAPGELELEASAVAAGTPGDRARRRLTVLPRGDRLERRSQAALSAGVAKLELLPGTSREVEITLSAGMAGVVSEACEGLIAYPYGCVEQTMSRFMPAVVVARAFKQAKISIAGSDLELKLPRAIGKGLYRLAEFQHADGGWGWWKHDASNDVMTAYVLQGLARCRMAGVRVPRHVPTRAAEYLARRLARRSLHRGRVGRVAELDVVAQVTLALAMHKSIWGGRRIETTLHMTARRFAKGEPLGNEADYNRPQTRLDHLAWLLALRLIGDASINVEERFDALRVAVEKKASRRHRVMTSALELELLVALKRDARADGVAAALVAQRRGTGWGDTLLTATVVQGLSGLLARQAAEPSRLAVEVDGKRVAVVEARGALIARHRLDVAALAGAKSVVLRPLAGAGAWSARQVGYVVDGRPNGDAAKVTASWLQRSVDAAQDAHPLPLKLANGGSLALRRGAPLTLRLDCTLRSEARLMRLTIPRPCGVELVHVNRKQPGVTHITVSHDAIHIFIDHWKAGLHTLELQLRPEIAGTISAPGPILAPMYGPELARKVTGWPQRLHVR